MGRISPAVSGVERSWSLPARAAFPYRVAERPAALTAAEDWLSNGLRRCEDKVEQQLQLLEVALELSKHAWLSALPFRAYLELGARNRAS